MNTQQPARQIVRVCEEDGYLMFWCPGCSQPRMIRYAKAQGGPQWGWNGDRDRPTLAPSVRVSRGPENRTVCHSFVRDGQIQFLGDSIHSLAGKTVPLPQFPTEWISPGFD